MKAKSIIKPALIIYFLMTICAVTAHGQDTDDLGDFIQRNAELLQQAKELVSKTSSVKARASLHTAGVLHAQSVNLATSANDASTSTR